MRANLNAMYDAQFSFIGFRAMTATKALLNKVDDRLGYMSTASSEYVVRKISQYNSSFDPQDFTSETDLRNFVKYAARATAHARSDKDFDTTYITYNFEQGALNAIAAWSNTKTTMSNLGEGYVDQVLTDYDLFLELRDAGDF